MTEKEGRQGEKEGRKLHPHRKIVRNTGKIRPFSNGFAPERTLHHK